MSKKPTTTTEDVTETATPTEITAKETDEEALERKRAEYRSATFRLMAKFPKNSDHHNKFAVDAAMALTELGWHTQINEQGNKDDPTEVDPVTGEILTKTFWIWKELPQ